MDKPNDQNNSMTNNKAKNIETKIWFVLPAYNEEEALPPLLESIHEVFTEDNKPYCILIVNDGSKDNTQTVIESYAKKYPIISIQNDGNKGLAETIRRGLMEASQRSSPKDIIVTMDSDNTHPVGLALRMIRSIKEGNDVVIASRYREGSHVRGLTLFRKFLSLGASYLFRIFFPIRGVRDFTCGYRAYRAGVMKDLIEKHGNEFITERGFSCMVDILLRLRENNLVFTEAPLVLRYDQKPGESKMNVGRTIYDTLLLLIKRRLSRSSHR